MNVIHDPSLTPFIAKWVEDSLKETGEVSFTGNYNSLGVVHNDALVAGFVYHDWNPLHRTIQMTLVSDSPRWASRKVISKLLSYPFIELNVQRITVIVNESNSASLRLAEGVGFKREAIIERGAGEFGNVIVLRLFVEEWLAGKYRNIE